MQIQVNTKTLTYTLIDNKGTIIRESKNPKELAEYAYTLIGMINTAAAYNEQIQRFVKGQSMDFDLNHPKCFDLDFKRIILESEQNWDESNLNTPFISFPSDWQIKIMMPTGNATARFVVKLPDGRTKSVYFDDKNALGYMDKPYYEVYPVGDEPARFYTDEIPELLTAIQSPGDLKYEE